MNYNNGNRFLSMALLLGWAEVMAAQGNDMIAVAGVQHFTVYLIAVFLIALIVMIFYNRLYYFRERRVNTHTSQLNTQLALVLNSNKTQVWTYDAQKRIFTYLADQGQRRVEYTSLELSKLFFHNDFNILRNVIASILDGEKEKMTVILRARPSFRSNEEHTYETTVSLLSRTKDGSPILIGNGRDITSDIQKREDAQKLSLRYHTLFNSSLTDMIFYDANGVLVDLNDKACETFRITDKEALLRRKVKINEVPAYQDLDIQKLDGMIEMSSITDIDKAKREGEKIPELKVRGRFYYEVIVNPIRDEHGRLHGVMTAGRNITEMVESHHRQQKARRMLARTTRDVETYISNINYALRVSGVRLINYYPDKHELDIYSDLNNAQYHLSQVRCMDLVHESDRRRARGLFRRMDRKVAGSFSETLHFVLLDDLGREIFFTFNMIPMTGPDGSITHYFGMLRNDTETAYTESQLEEETKKARETEELKNSFLLNMSYEIRTPLNAVLGFAELFNNPHDEQDEPVFAEEIRRNTGDLLALINDILFISRLDARMVEFNYKECDFASLFDGYCYMGWSVLSPGVEVSVENPYSQLMVKIDDQNLGQVIQKLCAYASRFTTEGTIRAKYEYRHGELNIAIEDSSKGISKEMLPHVFDRFARDETESHNGTGLDLPIVKELVEQMGGSIELQSEPGKGSTVYVIIPCEMSSMEKKTENVII